MSAQTSLLPPPRPDAVVALDRLAADDVLNLTPADVGTDRALACVDELDAAVAHALHVVTGAAP